MCPVQCVCVQVETEFSKETAVEKTLFLNLIVSWSRGTCSISQKVKEKARLDRVTEDLHNIVCSAQVTLPVTIIDLRK